MPDRPRFGFTSKITAWVDSRWPILARCGRPRVPGHSDLIASGSHPRVRRAGRYRLSLLVPTPRICDNFCITIEDATS